MEVLNGIIMENHLSMVGFHGVSFKPMTEEYHKSCSQASSTAKRDPWMPPLSVAAKVARKRTSWQGQRSYQNSLEMSKTDQFMVLCTTKDTYKMGPSSYKLVDNPIQI